MPINTLKIIYVNSFTILELAGISSSSYFVDNVPVAAQQESSNRLCPLLTKIKGSRFFLRTIKAAHVRHGSVHSKIIVFMPTYTNRAIKILLQLYDSYIKLKFSSLIEIINKVVSSKYYIHTIYYEQSRL